VKYNPLKTNWTKRDVPGDTIYIDMGTVNPGDDGTIQLVTMAPSNLNKTIMEQGIYINWQDNYQYHHRGFTLLLPLKAAMPGPIAPPPDPIGSPLPTDLPTTGPFARQPAPSASQPNTVLNWYLAATGHNLGGDFLSYWLEHGSVQVLGYPISELFKEPESNLVLQYFERGVMEYHPENNPPYQVLLKSLGSELNKATPSVTSDNPPSPDSVYYPDTGHWLDGRFVSYWQKNGGLDQFGYPISEPKIEGNRLIQWTERARFEVDINTNFIPLAQLGLVGNEFAQFKGYLPKPAAGG
jgi:hypothetical protein